ncbi:hypothetical protein ACQYWQ_20845 [Streptomyces sp. P6-2-1]|uniref:hypothetical protein n=1 Tax=Streptomyces sp. P6-2-1 TaxID=3422591 RepID=UPI003D35EB59
MSRDTESSSSGPRGSGGGAAYPSGTPPYGTPAQGEDGTAAPQDAAASGAGRSEERRTETTMTTRIKINIPGSRPIPPVVLRTPMSEKEKEERAARGEDAGGPQGTQGAPQARERARPAPVPPPARPQDGGQGTRPGEQPGPSGQSGPAGPGGQPQGGTAPREEKPASDWFAPRKNATRGGNTPSPAAPAQGGGTEGAGLPGGGTPPGGAPGGAAGASGGGAGAAGAGVSGAGAPGAGASGAGGYGAPTPAAGTPLGGNAGGRQAQQGGRSTGAYDVTQAFADAPPQGSRPAGGPGGPQGGPPSGGRQPGGPQAGDPQARGPQAGPRPAAGAAESETTAQHPAPGGSRSPWPSVDDTAILTPQQPRTPRGPADGAGPGGGSGAQVSGDTLTGGLPVVPPQWENNGAGADRVTMRQDPLGPGAGSPSFPVPGAAARFPEPVTPPPAEPEKPAAKAAKPKKKGRSKLGLLVGVVVVIAAGGYGAGLLMNRSDVPKGTTVLGVDIGGGTRDEAVNKLDSALGKRALAALPLTVDGKAASLKPDKSGLSLDSQATVRGAATSDYNPVSVFGSLIGKERVVSPVMPVDKEKLADALSRVAGTSGSLKEGTITFSPGKATPVYGKPGRTLDVDTSMDVVAQAYRDQVQAGKTTPVSLPLTEHKPAISDAEVDRMMKDFATPAMSGLVTIKAGAASIQFGPDRSLPQILGVKAVGGKLVDTYDLKALEELYGSTFDGVLITRGTGEKTAVTPQDVVGALREALRGKTPAERTVEIKTNPS